MADWAERAFDLVSEITKQVLTLAAAIITVTITFIKDFATHASSTAKDVLAWGWGFYALSIMAGFLTLMASAGVQQAKHDALAVSEPTRTPEQIEAAMGSINSGNLRMFGAIQLLTFFVAVVLTIVAGVMAV